MRKSVSWYVAVVSTFLFLFTGCSNQIQDMGAYSSVLVGQNPYDPTESFTLGYIQGTAATNGFTDPDTENPITRVPVWYDTPEGAVLHMLSASNFSFYVVTDLTNNVGFIGAYIFWDDQNVPYSVSNTGTRTYQEYYTYDAASPGDSVLHSFEIVVPMVVSVNAQSNLWGWNTTQIAVKTEAQVVYPMAEIAEGSDQVQARALAGVYGTPGGNMPLPLYVITVFTNEGHTVVTSNTYAFATNGIRFEKALNIYQD